MGVSSGCRFRRPAGIQDAGTGLSLWQRYLGQELSMKSRVLLVSLPLIQSVMPFQNEPEPTAPGIMSEPSNRMTVLGSCRICTDSLSIVPVTALWSRPLLAENQSPSLARLVAHSGEDR